MLSPRNDVVLHCVTYRNTVLLQPSSSKTQNITLDFAVLSLSNTTGSQIVDRGLGLSPFKIKEVQSKCNIKKKTVLHNTYTIYPGC